MITVNKGWTSNLKKGSEESEEFRLRLVHSQDVLERLCEILDQKIEDATKSMTSTENYDKPAWSEMMADKLGYIRALQELKTYTEIKTKE